MGTCQDYLSRAIRFLTRTETLLVFLRIAIANISLPQFWQSINENTELNRNFIAYKTGRYYHYNFGPSLVGNEEFDDLALEQISK